MGLVQWVRVNDLLDDAVRACCFPPERMMSSDQRFSFLKERIGLDVTSVGRDHRARRAPAQPASRRRTAMNTGNCCKVRGMNSRR
jgi:hypothetical protein